MSLILEEVFDGEEVLFCIKVTNNCAKVIIKSLCNFFFFLNQVTIFIQNNTSIGLAVFVRKTEFTIYPKRFPVSRVIRTEVFKLSLFIQVNNVVTLFLIFS